MAKFLVLTHPKEPLSDSGYKRLAGRVAYWKGLHDQARAEVYSVVGSKGYVVLIDVESHDELIDVLIRSPMGQDEEHEVYALGTVEAEAESAEAARFADRVA